MLYKGQHSETAKWVREIIQWKDIKLKEKQRFKSVHLLPALSAMKTALLK